MKLTVRGCGVSTSLYSKISNRRGEYFGDIRFRNITKARSRKTQQHKNPSSLSHGQRPDIENNEFRTVSDLQLKDMLRLANRANSISS